MAGKITVVGLGAGDMDQLTLGVYKQLKQAKEVYMRTQDHPLTAELMQEVPSLTFFDEIYEKHGQFDAVYEEITDILFQEAEEKDIVYAVPGHPFVAEKTVQLLVSQQKERGVEVYVAGGQSFLDATFNSLQIDPIEGLQFVDAGDMRADDLKLTQHVLICQVYDQMTASNVKLTLMEKLPDDYEVFIVTAAGSSQEQITGVPLFELDRDVSINNLTSVYVPPIQDEKLLYQQFDTFREVIRTLRGPGGCPWDQKQTNESLKPYLIEECYELLEAIDEDDPDHMVEELGDVLLQVLLHVQIGEDDGYFSMDDVIQHVTEKMIRRHPHVFGDTDVSEASDVVANWEKIKQQEKPERAASILQSIPTTLPALTKAYKLQKKAAKVGFDWTEVEDIWNKYEEEKQEFLVEVAEKTDEGATKQMKDEFGDLLFVLVNIGRFYHLEPETALSSANTKFMRRFQHIEQKAKDIGRSLEDLTLEEMDDLWNDAKRIERGEHT
ncbi:nucleoside triphosphate pyrophosphohydrolase [Bacillus altitudinis]|uniref:nucleoside triphosphate pyrophosphohydrolase n=1 Tax=Bacillus altitudinis TaxID=293387 RepID=UPI001C23FD76|nr:nucleoside triphosphate pyrophosphohydrolase [Bacillus altitudinis]MBU8654901.1 nucleoside triphosphate pyrophosphohydrolase [Bacillus altitudinis]MBU8780418.1 nucleoside triphosphate pyrophosphohydrolase [Bacillus altitudinis]